MVWYWRFDAKFIPVSLLHFCHQLVGGKLAPYNQDQVFDDILGAVNIQEPSNYHRQTAWVHLYIHKLSFTICSILDYWICKQYVKVTHFLHVDLDVLLQAVSVQVEYKIMDEVEAIAHNNERQLVGEFSFLSVKRRGNEKITSDFGHKRRHVFSNTIKSAKGSRRFLTFKNDF